MDLLSQLSIQEPTEAAVEEPAKAVPEPEAGRSRTLPRDLGFSISSRLGTGGEASVVGQG